jgi:hypothetical protein
MKLITAHKILISTAVVFFAFIGLWESRNYSQENDIWAAIRAIVYFLVAVGFGIYLQTLKRWYK